MSNRVSRSLNPALSLVPLEAGLAADLKAAGAAALVAEAEAELRHRVATSLAAEVGQPVEEVVKVLDTIEFTPTGGEYRARDLLTNLASTGGEATAALREAAGDLRIGLEAKIDITAVPVRSVLAKRAAEREAASGVAALALKTGGFTPTSDEILKLLAALKGQNFLLDPYLLKKLNFGKKQARVVLNTGVLHVAAGQDRRITEALLGAGVDSLEALALRPRQDLVAALQPVFAGAAKHKKSEAAKVANRLLESVDGVLPSHGLIRELDVPTNSRRATRNALQELADEGRLLRRLGGILDEKYDVLPGANVSAQAVEQASTRMDAIKTEGLNLDYLKSDLERVAARDGRGRAPSKWEHRFWRRYQLLFRIAGTPAGAVALADAGVRSARDAAVNERLDPNIRRRAREIVGEISNSVLSVVQGEELPAAVNQVDQPQNERSVNFSKLFAARSVCDCKECNSVLGPAAYFAEIMDYALLVEERAGADLDPQRTLKARRPDLWSQPLDCDAANQKVAFLSIVNRLLRDSFAGRQPGKEALTYAAGAKNRFSLPLNPVLDQVDAYLKKLEVERSGVARVVWGKDEPDAGLHLAAARLRSSPELAATLDHSPSPALLKKLFGPRLLKTRPATDDALLEAVGLPGLPAEPLANILMPDLLQAVGLERAEFKSCVNTDYVRASDEFVIWPRRSSAASLQNDVEVFRGASYEMLRRLHRFLRARQLVAKSGADWEPAEVSAVLAASEVAASNAGTALSTEFARLVSLSRRLKLEPAVVVGLVHQLPTKLLRSGGERSLSERVYGGSDSVLTTPRSYPASRLRLGTVLDIEPVDLDQAHGFLLTQNRAPSIDTDLDEVALQSLFAVTRFAQAFGLPLAAIVTLLRLVAEEGALWVPGGGLSPAALMRVIEFGDLLATAEIKVDAVARMLDSRQDLELSAAELQLALSLHERLPETRVEDELDGQLGSAYEAWCEESFGQGIVQLVAMANFFGLQLPTEQELQSFANAALTPRTAVGDLVTLQRRLVAFVEEGMLLELGEESPLETLVRLELSFGRLPATLGEVEVLVRAFRLLPVSAACLHGAGASLAPAVENWAVDDPSSFAETFQCLTEELDDFTDAEWPQLEGGPESASEGEQALRIFEQLARRIEVSRWLGASGTELLALRAIEAPKTLDTLNPLLDRRLRAKHEGGAEYRDAAADIQAIRNEGERDALLAALKDPSMQPVGGPRLLTDRDWFDFLLIDVRRGACDELPSLEAAHVSVQAYIDRVTQDLEPGISTDHVKDFEWAYRGNFRRWQASRALYLHPENHLSPEFRDDKTELYSQFEQDLLQQQVTSQTALAAYRAYVRKFRELCRLQITGAYSTGKGREDVVVLCGVSANEPAEHYIQTYTPESRIWEEWKRVDAPIPVRQVCPVVDGETIRLYWVEHATRAVNQFRSGNSELGGYRHSVVYKYVERLAGGGWSQPQQIDVDFEPLGYGETNVVFDRFAKESAVASKLQENATVKTQAAVLFSLSEPLEVLFTIGGADYGPIEFGKDIFGDLARKMMDAGVAWTFLDLIRSHVALTRLQVKEITLQLSPDMPITFGFDEVAASYENATIRLAGSGGIPLSSLSYQVRERIEDELLGDDADTVLETPTPMFDTRPHYSAREGYGLSSPGWARPYVEVASGGNYLTFPGDLTASETSFADRQVNLTTRDAAKSIPAKAPPSTAQWLRLEEGQRVIRAYGAAAPSAFPWLPPDGLASRDLFADARKTARASELISMHAGEPSASGNLSPSVPLVSAIRSNSDIEFLAVGGEAGSAILSIDGESYLVLERSGDGSSNSYRVCRLGSSLGDPIARHFNSEDISLALSLGTQLDLNEAAAPLRLEEPCEDELRTGELPFDGPMGVYFRELYFHIPHAIAHALQAQGQYVEARKWLEYLFDPEASNAEPNDGAARVWRSRYLREANSGTGLPSFESDAAALSRLEEDPFNPYAIARLRRSAFQKAVFTSWVKNVVDYADTLFRKFERSEVEQALRLYMRARQILGERPYRLEECGERGASNYDMLKAPDGTGEDLLRQVERKLATPDDVVPLPNEAAQRRLFLAFLRAGDRGIWENRTKKTSASRTGKSVQKALTNKVPLSPTVTLAKPLFDGLTRRWNGAPTGTEVGGGLKLGFQQALGAETVPQRLIEQLLAAVGAGGPVFCVPANPEQDRLWNLIDDRVGKIRTCKDIDGVRRALEPYGSRLDLGQLVRSSLGGSGSGAGLSLLTGLVHLPFAYLENEAERAIARVVSLGNSFLSAIERHAGEELSRLRTAHEGKLLEHNTNLRKMEIDAAEEGLKGLKARRDTLEYRRAHNEALLSVDLIAEERKQQQSQELARGLRTQAVAVDLLATILHLIPELGAPTAMKFGGMQLGSSAGSFSGMLRMVAGVLDGVASAASLEASFARRRESWENQIEVLTFELLELESQLRGAEIRVGSATETLRVHKRQREQVQVLEEFHRDKFNSTELYSWMVGRSNALQRTAFEIAQTYLGLARWKLESDLGVEPPASTAGAWHPNYGGVLAGEVLQADLDQLRRGYNEAETGLLRVTQSFSLADTQGDRLHDLWVTGSTSFSVTRGDFDLDFPAHYHRVLRSARLIVHATVGSGVNLGVELALLESGKALTRAQAAPELEPTGDALGDWLRSRGLNAGGGFDPDRIAVGVPRFNDGSFEFAFGNAAKRPFAGQGAVSKWELKLPTRRRFDYSTISDVELVLSYTAKHGEEAATTGSDAVKVFLARRDFPDRVQALTAGEAAAFVFSPSMFPFAAADGGLPVITKVEYGFSSWRAPENGTRASVTANDRVEVAPDAGAYSIDPASLGGRNARDLAMFVSYKFGAS